MLTLGIDIGSCRVKAVLASDGQIIRYFDASCQGIDVLQLCRQLAAEYPVDQVGVTGSRDSLPRLLAARQVPLAAALFRGGQGQHPSCRTVVDIGCAGTRLVAGGAQGCVSDVRDSGWSGTVVGGWLDEAARLLALTPAELALTTPERQRQPEDTPLLVHTTGELKSLLGRGMHRQVVARAVLRGAGEHIAWSLRRFPLQNDLVFAGGWGDNLVIREQLQKRLGLTVAQGCRSYLVGAFGAALVAGQEEVHYACAAH